jgi:DNA-binding XRE family transcriptional regulator
MQRIYARPIRDIFRPRLSGKLELIAELHLKQNQYIPDAHIVRETKSGMYFMHRGGGVLVDLPQEYLIAALHDAGLLPGESPTRKVKRELAELMKNWRQSARINAREAGARLGLSARTIEGIEQGRGFSHPNLLVMALIQATKE